MNKYIVSIEQYFLTSELSKIKLKHLDKNRNVLPHQRISSCSTYFTIGRIAYSMAGYKHFQDIYDLRIVYSAMFIF
ncbi:hypothetical protein AQU20_10795 [Escherichia albertii]|nr:hypothetical protein AQU20_10795 [Escherichia albertii]